MPNPANTSRRGLGLTRRDFLTGATGLVAGLAIGRAVLGPRREAAPYLGLVATRGYVFQDVGFRRDVGGLMSRSAHTSRDGISRLNLVYANWYVNGTTGEELGTGGPARITASIEYPEGRLTRALFSGDEAGIAPSGANLISDEVEVEIPNDTPFWVRTNIINEAGVLFLDNKANSALGDRLSFDPTDLTGTGEVADGLPGYTHPPLAIIGLTARPSALLIGTSRTFGLLDEPDLTGDIGVLARSVGPSMAYINAGVPNDSAAHFLENSSKRRAIATYATDVFVEHGINDDQTTIQADLAALYALFPDQRVHAITVSPSTRGAWAEPDGSDQMIAVDVTPLNDFLRRRPAPLFAVYDVADVTMSGRNTNKWRAPGFTADGLHESQLAAIAIRNSGAIDLEGVP